MSENKMSAQDRLEVMELIGRYQQCIDGGDAEAYASNFVPDGVVEWASGVRRGRDEIREWVAGMFAGGRVGAEPAQVRHFVGLPYIHRGDSERCAVRTYMVLFTYNDEGEVVASSHWTYLDDVVKVDGEWLFEKRYMQQDMRITRPRPPSTSSPDTRSASA
jgi:uncharacterized protein (TIGR02246 family)